MVSPHVKSAKLGVMYVGMGRGRRPATSPRFSTNERDCAQKSTNGKPGSRRPCRSRGDYGDVWGSGETRGILDEILPYCRQECQEMPLMVAPAVRHQILAAMENSVQWTCPRKLVPTTFCQQTIKMPILPDGFNQNNSATGNIPFRKCGTSEFPVNC